MCSIVVNDVYIYTYTGQMLITIKLSTFAKIFKINLFGKNTRRTFVSDKGGTDTRGYDGSLTYNTMRFFKRAKNRRH